MIQMEKYAHCTLKYTLEHSDYFKIEVFETNSIISLNAL